MLEKLAKVRIAFATKLNQTFRREVLMITWNLKLTLVEEFVFIFTKYTVQLH